MSNFASLDPALIDAALHIAKRLECGSCCIAGGPGDQRYRLCCDPDYMGAEAFSVAECECIAEARAGRFGVYPTDTTKAGEP